MFVQTFGFDRDLFKNGVAVSIEDNHNPNTCFRKFIRDEHEHWDKNVSGNYLVIECYSHQLTLRNVRGEMVYLPVRHFIVNVKADEFPRMTVKVLQ